MAISTGVFFFFFPLHFLRSYFGSTIILHFNHPVTLSVALLFAFPIVNFTVPLMSTLVLFRMSLWTVPWFSRRTEGPGLRFSPFKVQTGGLFMATDDSHWKVAGSPSITSTSSSSFTITRAWAGATQNKSV